MNLNKNRTFKIDPSLNLLPKKVDWSQHATLVKNQNDCGACYAFAAISSLELQINKTQGKFLYLSEQEIVDCSFENTGCIGGNPYKVFDYINKNGISLESAYPYTAQKNKTCKKIPHIQRFRGNIKYYFVRDPVDLIKALNIGPVVIIHHGNQYLKDYNSGILNPPQCQGVLNHSAVAVGYNLEGNIPFIRLKNVWGLNWGELGYYNMALGDVVRGGKGLCNMFDHNANVIPTIN